LNRLLISDFTWV